MPPSCGARDPMVSQRTLRMFLDHLHGPETFRELENVVKNIVALGEEELGLFKSYRRAFAASLAPAFSERRLARPFPEEVAARAASREAERDLILQALARTRWNRKTSRPGVANQLHDSRRCCTSWKQIGLQDSEAN